MDTGMGGWLAVESAGLVLIVALAGTDMIGLVGLVWGWVEEKPCVWYVYVYVGCTESFGVRPRP